MSIEDQTGSTVLHRTTKYQPPRSWRTWLVGRPLTTAYAPHQTIGKAVGLAVFASDALSSTAYATQEILVILAMAGAAQVGTLGRRRAAGDLEFSLPPAVRRLLGYIEEIAAQRQPNEAITVVVPQFVPRRWWHNLLHAQAAIILRLFLLSRPQIVVTDVPYQPYEQEEAQKQAER